MHSKAYVMHDVSKWRDLNVKFVLSVFRDYVATSKKEETKKHAEFLMKKAWPICQKVLGRHKFSPPHHAELIERDAHVFSSH